MDELIRQLGQYPGSATATVSMVQTIAAVLLSFVLALIIAFIYKATHTGTSYSQSFFHTLIIMSVVVSLIMIIIGSNIARAFSLVCGDPICLVEHAERVTAPESALSRKNEDHGPAQLL